MIRNILPYVFIVLIVVFIRTFFITPIFVFGDSMENTLQSGNIMFLNKIDYYFNDIKRFDIVVIRTKSSPVIKRIIGLPGESVDLVNGEVYINGNLLEQKFDYIKDNDTYEFGSIIPKDNYFVLGDNRAHSSDSRVFGLVDKDLIIGKAELVLWPIKEIGLK